MRDGGDDGDEFRQLLRHHLRYQYVQDPSHRNRCHQYSGSPHRAHLEESSGDGVLVIRDDGDFGIGHQPNHRSHRRSRPRQYPRQASASLADCAISHRQASHRQVYYSRAYQLPLGPLPSVCALARPPLELPGKVGLAQVQPPSSQHALRVPPFRFLIQPLLQGLRKYLQPLTLVNWSRSFLQRAYATSLALEP